jgi:branched-chain amino acid transport system permease protein
MTKKLRIQIVVIAAVVVAAVLIFLWKPTALVYGLQRAGLYAAIALPMALVLGIVHIANLAHGELMMVSAYITYFLSRTLGVDPFVAMLITAPVMFAVGVLIYKLTISRAVKAPELNQLILTFGVAMVLSQLVNLIATSQPRKLSIAYVTASMTVGETSFGIFDFLFVGLAIALLVGLQLFLKKTKLGQAATAVGQNPNGAAIIGINVQRTYTLVFAIAAGLLGIIGTFFLARFSLFPTVGGSYTMKSFCLVAMAGIGNLPMIAVGSLILAIAESSIQAIPGGGSWAPLVFFALIILVIMVRSFRRAS